MELKIDLNRIPNDDKMELTLRSLYESCGYRSYKMSKFEEYELYAHNRDFLGDGGIMTFTDVSGRLMALKPDVTLSIVKNSKASTGTQKVYYRENVYRASKNNGFKEISQCGIECIGDIDNCNTLEVLILALKSLKATNKPFKLMLSHMGILASFLKSYSLSDAESEQIQTCIKRKNAGGIKEILKEETCALAEALSLNGEPASVINELKKICLNEGINAVEELEEIVNSLIELGYGDNIGIDLCVVNDMNYYRSLVFKGYIDCVPECVLIGGRYDDLVKKMGRDSGAIGFALYLDKLSLINESYLNVPDILLRYTSDIPYLTVIKYADELRNKGYSVVTSAFENICANRVININSDGTIKEVR